MLYIKEFDAPNKDIEEKKEELEMLEKKYLEAAAAVEKEEETRKQNALAAAPSPPNFTRTASSSCTVSTTGLAGIPHNASISSNTSLMHDSPPPPPFNQGASWSRQQDSQTLSSILARQPHQNTLSLFGTSRLSGLGGGLVPSAAVGTASLAARQAELRTAAALSRAGLNNHLSASVTATGGLPLQRTLYGGLNAALPSLQPLNTPSFDSVRLQLLQESMRNTTAAPYPGINATASLYDSLSNSNQLYLDHSLRRRDLLERETVHLMASAPPASAISNVPKHPRDDDDEGEEGRAPKRGNFNFPR